VEPDAVVAVVVVERAGEPVARWPVPLARTTVDVGHVDALARLVLAARRLGAEVHVEQVDQALVDLLDLVGLGREVLGEPEGGEQPALHLEEVVVADDPVR
jgi:hypothetical protein